MESRERLESLPLWKFVGVDEGIVQVLSLVVVADIQLCLHQLHATRRSVVVALNFLREEAPGSLYL